MTNISLPSETKNSHNIEILVVEDDYDLALNFQEILESLGYKVIDIANSAEAAIHKANQLYPNLILMNIHLRGQIDGIQAAGQIWDNLQIPVIYVTGFSDRSTLERATQTYPFAYILKPVTQQKLYVAIETALERYEIEQFLRSVLQGIGEGVIVVDSQLCVKYLNQVAEKLIGWKLSVAKDKIFSEVIELINEATLLPVQNPIIRSIEQEITVHQSDRTLLVSKGGDTIPITSSASPIRNNKGEITGVVMVFRDESNVK